jgi:FixJ family two-component response regulator
MGKIMFISNDTEMSKSLQTLSSELSCDFSLYSNSKDPLDIISEVVAKTSNILILDDDYLSPNSTKLLVSIKKVSPKLPVIFMTSDTGLELGRSVNSIGVKYYLIKPITEVNLREFIISVKTQNDETNLIY